LVLVEIPLNLVPHLPLMKISVGGHESTSLGGHIISIFPDNHELPIIKVSDSYPNGVVYDVSANRNHLLLFH
jgi:hypothetical protein